MHKIKINPLVKIINCESGISCEMYNEEKNAKWSFICPSNSGGGYKPVDIGNTRNRYLDILMRDGSETKK